MKVCIACNQSKSLNEFGKDLHIKDGYKSRCLPCMAIYQKVYRLRKKDEIAKKKKLNYEKNKSSILAQKKVYYTNNKDKLTAIKKVYYSANKPHIADKHKQYREKHKDQLNEYSRQYRKRDEYKLQAKHYSHSRRARIQSSDDGTISKSTLSELLIVQNHRCYYCNKILYKNDTTLDHYILISKQGTHSIGNVVFACFSCNRSKSAKIPSVPLTFPIKGN